MASIQFDQSRWPLVVVTHHGEVSDEQFDEYLGKLKDNLDRAIRERMKTVIIFDATNATGSSAKQRQKQAAWMKQYEAPSRLHSAGYAFVIPSTIVRGALTAILWLSPMPAPYVVVATLAEAEAWSLKVLAQASEERRMVANR